MADTRIISTDLSQVDENKKKIIIELVEWFEKIDSLVLAESHFFKKLRFDNELFSKFKQGYVNRLAPKTSSANIKKIITNQDLHKTKDQELIHLFGLPNKKIKKLEEMRDDLIQKYHFIDEIYKTILTIRDVKKIRKKIKKDVKELNLNVTQLLLDQQHLQLLEQEKELYTRTTLPLALPDPEKISLPLDDVINYFIGKIQEFKKELSQKMTPSSYISYLKLQETWRAISMILIPKINKQKQLDLPLILIEAHHIKEYAAFIEELKLISDVVLNNFINVIPELSQWNIDANQFATQFKKLPEQTDSSRTLALCDEKNTYHVPQDELNKLYDITFTTCRRVLIRCQLSEFEKNKTVEEMEYEVKNRSQIINSQVLQICGTIKIANQELSAKLKSSHSSGRSDKSGYNTTASEDSASELTSTDARIKQRLSKSHQAQTVSDEKFVVRYRKDSETKDEQPTSFKLKRLSNSNSSSPSKSKKIYEKNTNVVFANDDVVKDNEKEKNKNENKPNS